MNERVPATKANCTIGSWLWTNRTIDPIEGSADGFVRILGHVMTGDGAIHIRFMGTPKALGGNRGQEQEIPWNLIENGTAGLFIPLPGEIERFVEKEKCATSLLRNRLDFYVDELCKAPTEKKMSA